MPLKPFKNSKNFKETVEEGKRPKTANETKIGTLLRKTGVEKKWVQKKLSSKQEVLVECVTGEIYRYLIGERQPKIRTGGPNEILSEFMPYRSIRDILDVPEKRTKIDGFKRAFCADLDGFMLVLYSSIFMEENDLSDQNYGLSVLSKSEGKTEEVQEDGETYVNILEGSSEQYGQFLKIDHGQSLNSLRIGANYKPWKPLSIAEIKHFHSPEKKDLDIDGMDKRNKGQRETIWHGFRKYNMDPTFLDGVIQDFLFGLIDRDYIIAMKFQPSALPLYDGRLIPFFDGISEAQRYDWAEWAKFRSIAKIVFTNSDIMLGIATYAAHMEDPKTLASIIRKILDNKDAFFKAIRVNLDFCVLCHVAYDDILERIRESHERMTHKRPKLGERPGKSDRYGELGAMNPVDLASIAKLKKVGEYFFKSIEKARELIGAIIHIVETHNWKVSSGGQKVNIKGVLKTVPETIYHMKVTLGRHHLSPQARCFRTLEELIYLSCLAAHKSSFWRSAETKEGYKKIATAISTAAATEPSIRYLLEKYSRKEVERYLDYYELSDEIVKFAMKNRR